MLFLSITHYDENKEIGRTSCFIADANVWITHHFTNVIQYQILFLAQMTKGQFLFMPV